MTIDSLQHQTALVTGAGRGIGRAIALALAEQGANVVVSSRTENEIDDVAHEIERLGHQSLSVAADVSNEVEVKGLIEKTIQKFGTIDILINNAGIGYFSKVAEMKLQDFDRMWSVNMRGAFLCTQAVLPYMIKQKSGDVVNIDSLAGRNAFIGGSGYAATKWALLGWSRCLMLEVREHNIRVITLCPGSVDTTFGGGSHSTPKSSGAIPRAEDIAQVTIDALQMPRNVMVSEIDIRPTNPKG